MATLYTREQVAARNRRGDAALVIDNVVYDVTGFLDEHPGGAEVLLANAGRDASRCFRDVGHSEEAVRLRRRLRAGELVAAEWREEAGAPPAAPPPVDEDAALRGLWRALAPPLLAAALTLLLYALLLRSNGDR